jgi:hypothetical protein
MLAAPIVLGQTATLRLRSGDIRLPEHAQPLQRERTDQPLRAPQHRCEASLTVGYRKEDPPFAAGESREELQTKLIRGTKMYRN